MNDHSKNTDFEKLNRGYNSVFKFGELSIGLVSPIESYPNGPVPTMDKHLQRIQLVEQLGFSSVWLRDVPFNVPSFGDAGQTYDPFVYLGLIAGQTKTIALGVASIILPVRHPAHIAKSAASVDVLSNGRLILGIASGDRQQEYPATDVEYSERGALFRESFDYIRKMAITNQTFDNYFGKLSGELDMIPKPVEEQLPLIITGASQQSLEWRALNGDGCMIYPNQPVIQKKIVGNWNSSVKLAGRNPQPVMQPLYFDLDESLGAGYVPIHLGFRSSAHYLVEYLKQLEAVGINHVALNLRFNQLEMEKTLNILAEKVLPSFN